MSIKKKVGIIGCGNMGGAILYGALESGILSKDDVYVYDINPAMMEKASGWGVHLSRNDEDVCQNADMILLAVKPQNAAEALAQCKKALEGKALMSIVAGVTVSRLQAMIDGTPRILRIMPNTPALVGEGMSAVAFSEGYRSRFVLDIFDSVGDVVEIDEKYFAAVTSLSGSGPAYVYMFIDALIKGGVEGGLPEEVAKKLAVGTVRGAAKMVATDKRSVEQLTEAVCSKGGTTIRAVESFREDGLEDVVKRGMEKCRKRAEELGDA